MAKLTDKNKLKMMEIAIRCAERNIINDNWTLETAQLYLKTVDEQPEEHKYLLRIKNK